MSVLVTRRVSLDDIRRCCLFGWFGLVWFWFGFGWFGQLDSRVVGAPKPNRSAAVFEHKQEREKAIGLIDSEESRRHGTPASCTAAARRVVSTK